MESVDDEGAEAAVWVERHEYRVADDEQRNDGDEHVHRNHQRQVFALYLVEPANGAEQEADARPALQFGSVSLSPDLPLAKPTGWWVLRDLLGRGWLSRLGHNLPPDATSQFSRRRQATSPCRQRLSRASPE